MVKNNVILVIAHLLILSGCIPAMEPVEKKGPALNVAVGMSGAEVINRLSRPDFTLPYEGYTIFFYCMYSKEDTSEGICAPVFFKDDTVAMVGETDSEKWSVDTVRFKVEQSRKEQIAKKKRDTKPSDSITVETLYAQKRYTPVKGDTVYVTYHTNFVRYIPLRSNPSKNGKTLKTICIGSELAVLDIQDQWLFVKGVDENFTGWILKRWVTDDHTVKIDAEKRREERAPEIARLEAIVKPIPQSEWKKNLRLYEKLLGLDPCNLYYQRKVDFYENYGRKVKQRRRR